MGHIVSKNQEQLAAFALVAATPGLYTSFLRLLERFATHRLNYNAATFGNMLKAYGCPIFVAGHASICLKKPALELPDVCYMSACSVLSAAFMGAYHKKPIPEAVFAAGMLFFGAYLPLRWRLLAAKADTLIPTVAVCAAPLLTWVGLTQLAVKYGLIEKPPKGPMTLAQTGTLAGTFLGVANCIKLLQMVQQRAPKDNVLFGQILKVIASVTCFTGNTLCLGWQQKAGTGDKIRLLQTASAAVFVLKLSQVRRTER